MSAERCLVLLAVLVAVTGLSAPTRADTVDVSYEIEMISSFGGVPVETLGEPGSMTIRWQGTPGSNIVPGPAKVVSLSAYQLFSNEPLGNDADLNFSLAIFDLTGPGTLGAYPGSVTIAPGTASFSGSLHCRGANCPNYGFTPSIYRYLPRNTNPPYSGVPRPISFSGVLDPALAPDTIDLFGTTSLQGLPVGIQLVGREVAGSRVHRPCGDVNCSGGVNVGDALQVAQYDVGLRQCGVAPFACEANCDIAPAPAGNGVCDIGDALFIAQCDAGLRSCEFACTAFSCPTQLAAQAASLAPVPQGAPTVSAILVVSPTDPCSGERLEAEVQLDVGSTPLGAYEFDLGWNPSVLALTDPVLGGATLEFSGAPTCNTEDAASGTIRCNAFQSLGLDSPTGLVSVAKVTLGTLGSACDESTLTLTVAALDTESVELPAANPPSQAVVVAPCGEPAPPSTTGKVTICHIPPGRPDKAKTLEIDFDSAADHLAHGDTQGPCN
jgi:hypothetical protein